MIVVIGSMNLDRIARVERFPGAGETVAIGSLTSAPGGKGGNVAAAAARLGARVAMVARVGTDADADVVVGALAAAGVDVSRVEPSRQEATGTAWIWVEATGENRIGVLAGANANLAPDVVERLVAARPPLLGPKALVVLNLEIPVATVVRSIALAHAAGCRVVLNLSPVGALGPEGLGPDDILVVNGPEAALLAGTSTPTRREAALRLAARLAMRGPGTVVITLGGQGAVAVRHSSRLSTTAVRVQPIDTTGAGDAFLGAFVAALDRGLALAQAIRVAVAAGAFTTTRPGAQGAQPNAEALDRFGRAHGLDLPRLGPAADGAGGAGAPPADEG